MKQWDRELSIKRDTRRENALKDIQFDIENDIPIDATRKRLKVCYGYDTETIEELLAQVENESMVNQ